MKEQRPLYAGTGMNGVEIIASERGRQTGPLGYDEKHDDTHTEGELALTAICYAAPDRVFIRTVHDDDGRVMFEDPWPWDEEEDDRRTDTGRLLSNSPPHLDLDDRIDQLAKAGALIAAEIDRLLRVRENERVKTADKPFGPNNPNECPTPRSESNAAVVGERCSDCGQIV